ncbi:MAG TPA: hypothetical protein VIM16_22190 [Mucilaginibacter sp.]|jgi:hypothetical protein
MAYSSIEFKNLESKYGEVSTWAIWEHSKYRIMEKSVKCIAENLTLLHSKYVLIGLNASRKIEGEKWNNFRGGRHDRKLKYALNDTDLRGAYMTDLFKEIVNPKSVDFYNYIKTNGEFIMKNVLSFKQEMSDIRISPETTFIIWGTENSLTARLYKQHFEIHFSDIKTIYHKHYSSRGFDKDWVESIWRTLRVDADFTKTKGLYN